MAERHMITPRITTEARNLLQEACKVRACSQTEVVEAALLAFLRRTDGAEAMVIQEIVLQRLTTLEGGFADLLPVVQSVAEGMQVIQEVLGQILGLMQQVVAMQEAQVPRPESPEAEERPPIATYEQLYGPMPAPISVEEALGLASPPPRRRRRRWLFKENGA
jgi:type IV secretory pathway VirB2 component (pilin)